MDGMNGGKDDEGEEDDDHTRHDNDMSLAVVEGMGVLGPLYACADVAVVGGALLERNAAAAAGPGQHNVFEPLLHGCAVLHGSHYADNFAAVRRTLLAAAAAADAEEDVVVEVGGPKELRRELLRRARSVRVQGERPPPPQERHGDAGGTVAAAAAAARTTSWRRVAVRLAELAAAGVLEETDSVLMSRGVYAAAERDAAGCSVEGNEGEME